MTLNSDPQMMTCWKHTRPACFDFAMEFLGYPENEEVEAYVTKLEKALALIAKMPHDAECLNTNDKRDLERARQVGPCCPCQVAALALENA